MSHRVTRRFDAADLEQIAAHGLDPAEVERQIDLFEHPPAPTRLDRPCTPGDGIRTLSEADIEIAHAAHADAARSGRLLKFVPASGAASRMFKSLLAVAGDPGPELTRRRLADRASAGDGDARETLAFFDNIERFAFFQDLEHALDATRSGRSGGGDIAQAIAEDRLGDVLRALLWRPGLDYAALPKGLIPFHRYPGGYRTAADEHLVEAALYARDAAGCAKLHFTVSGEHLDAFRARLEAAGRSLGERDRTRFSFDFSVQKRSTDTIAVDLENQPFRTSGGRLLFRPGGHGALIENLGELAEAGGDIVTVKNIDNVVPDDRKGLTVKWKKALIGLLVGTEQAVRRHLAALGAPTPSADEIARALRFARNELLLALPAGLDTASETRKRELLTALLDRPLRICGMVRSEGDPGGGPFWVIGKDGTRSPQIVEHAQVDAASPEQERIYSSATHFSPVDLVCALRDSQDRPFDLRRHVDPETVFISRKSSEGRELKALEHPGLWNGAMASWTTLFVEVPAATFTPVKTVNDLLRPEHQPRTT
jgi:hypothetical protein